MYENDFIFMCPMRVPRELAREVAEPDNISLPPDSEAGSHGFWFYSYLDSGPSRSWQCHKPSTAPTLHGRTWFILSVDHRSLANVRSILDV